MNQRGFNSGAKLDGVRSEEQKWDISLNNAVSRDIDTYVVCLTRHFGLISVIFFRASRTSPKLACVFFVSLW